MIIIYESSVQQGGGNTRVYVDYFEVERKKKNVTDRISD